MIPPTEFSRRPIRRSRIESSTDNNEITDTTNRIVTMQNDMVAQMSAADALIASLQNQVSYFTTLFQDTQNELTSGG